MRSLRNQVVSTPISTNCWHSSLLHSLQGLPVAFMPTISVSLEPKVFKLDKSIEILVMVVLGGMGSIRGSIIGAVALTILPELLRSVSEYRMLLYATVLILVMLYRYDDRLMPFRKKITDFFSRSDEGRLSDNGNIGSKWSWYKLRRSSCR